MKTDSLAIKCKISHPTYLNNKKYYENVNSLPTKHHVLTYDDFLIS